jgi:hypothetical protein
VLNGAVHLARELVWIDGLAIFATHEKSGQFVIPRQAADVGSQNTLFT